MTAGVRSPEELDALLEDAFLARDRVACRALFDDHALLVEAGGLQARGGESIGHAVAELWASDRTYVARSARVLRARDTALVVSDAAIHVLRRRGDGSWRAAISLITPEDT